MLNFAPYHRRYGQLHSGNLFGDRRIASRYAQLFTRMSSRPGVILHQLSQTYAEEAAYYRLLANKRFSFEDILRSEGLSMERSCIDRHILVLGDSTEIRLETKADHYEDKESIGYLSSNSNRGLLAHPSIALDADNLWVLGLCDLLIWGRPKAKQKKTTTLRDSLPLEEKESYKWFLGVKGSEEVLAQAKQITYVFDREADILSLFHQIDEQDSEFVIRIKHDRKLLDGKTKISEVLAQSPHRSQRELFIRGGKSRKNAYGRQIKGRSQRRAKLDICYQQIQLSKSKRPYYVLDVLESSDSVPQGEAPIHWRILTSHTINSPSDAWKILAFYAHRWLIEELFRIVKSKGFQLESVQVRSLSSVRKIIAMTMAAGLKVLQLSLAKSQQTQLPIELIFSKQEIFVLKLLSTKLEGKTEKLKNPYPDKYLIFAYWVFARLGGWKGYLKKRPPGPITLLRGVNRFEQFLQSFQFFNQLDVWEP